MVTRSERLLAGQISGITLALQKKRAALRQLVFCSIIIVTFVQLCVILLLVNPKMEGSEYESTQTETYNIGERSKTT